jgi:hypothetical protein
MAKETRQAYKKEKSPKYPAKQVSKLTQGECLSNALK